MARGTVRVRNGYGHASVAPFTDFGEKRNLAEKRSVLAGRFCPAAAMTKNLDALTARRGEIAHVLNDPEDRHVHLVEHGNAFADHNKGSFLRSGDNDAAIQRDSLAEGKLRVASAGRQIYQQDVQIAPGHRSDELLDRLHDHRSAPDNRI